MDSPLLREREGAEDIACRHLDIKVPALKHVGQRLGGDGQLVPFKFQSAPVTDEFLVVRIVDGIPNAVRGDRYKPWVAIVPALEDERATLFRNEVNTLMVHQVINVVPFHFFPRAIRLISAGSNSQ